MTLTDNSSDDNDDDDSSSSSLLVSPTKNVERRSWDNTNNFKHPNGGDVGDGDGDDDRWEYDDNTNATYNNDNNNRTVMEDITFQDSSIDNNMPHREEDDEEEEDDSFLLETATTPAKRKFSYAAAMEQLDDSWLAPTPIKQPLCRRSDGDDLDMTMEEEEEEEEEVVDVGECLEEEEQWSESSVKDEHVLDETAGGDDDDNISTVVDIDEKEDEAISSPEVAALAPAPKHSSPVTASTTMMAAQLNNQNTTTSAIFRHPSIHHNDQHQHQMTASSSLQKAIQLGHPINESYDSVEQRTLQLEQDNNCISSFLVDKDRVENDIVANKGGDEKSFGEDGGGGGGKEFNNSVLDTLEEQSDEEENDVAMKETGLFIEEEGDFNNSVLDTLEEHALTMTQTADCSANSDGFWKKIEHAENNNDEEDLVHDYEKVVAADGHDALNEEESDVAAEEEEGNGNDMNEGVPKSHQTNTSEEMTVERNVTLTEEENAENEDGDKGENKKDMMDEFAPESIVTHPEPTTEGVVAKEDAYDEEENKRDWNDPAPEYHRSSPSEPPAAVNDKQEPTFPAIESGIIGGDSNLESEGIVENQPELTSSRGGSLNFSTSADADDSLELSQQVQNTSQSSVLNANTEETNRDCLTLAAAEGVHAVDDYLEYSASNQPSSEVEANGADISFDGNSLSASLDVSLSNIDREALFAGTFQQLSPIRQNSSSPHDLSQRQDDDLKGDEIQQPVMLESSPISENSSPHECKSLLGADVYAKEEELDKSDRDTIANKNDNDCAVAARESVDYSPDTVNANAEGNKGSIFAVLSQVNADASSDEVEQDESPKDEEEDKIVSDHPGENNSKKYVNEDPHDAMEVQTNIETFTNKHVDFENPDGNEVDDDRNKSLEDLSSYQQSFNSTSTAFLERLRGAAASRKREVTKARFSMERKEQILYEEKEDRDVMPTLSEVAEEMVEEPIKRTDVAKTQVKPFTARPLPASQLRSENSHPRSTSTIGSKRKSPNSLRSHIDVKKPHGQNSAVNSKPPKRLLSGENASDAKEMNRRRLLQEDKDKIRREAVFRARPLPASTLPRGHRGGLEQQRMSHSSKAARPGKENSAFKPSSSARAEERAAYNEEKKAREEARQREQIQKRNALINETNVEIDNLKRYL